MQYTTKDVIEMKSRAYQEGYKNCKDKIISEVIAWSLIVLCVGIFLKAIFMSF